MNSLRKFWFQIIAKKTNVAQKQRKFSLIPAATDLEALNKVRQKFTSNLCFEKTINESEECSTANSITYCLVTGILYHLTAGFSKNMDSQYHRIVEGYFERQKEGRGIILLL